ncbi:MAG: KpsF/GutQ family sugar-phosphate isomerase [bacterium]
MIVPNQKKILKTGRKSLLIEIQGLKRTCGRLDGQFARAVDMIYKCRGKIIFFGIGKSGLVAQKIASTFLSIGTPSAFLHPVEAMHGSLSLVQKNDIIITVSKSGESEELNCILPSLKRLKVKIISIIGNKKSMLAINSDIVIDGSVEQEACPNALAPTASTTVALALGDAMAAAMVKLKNFRPEDFALFHPSGSLGKKLTLTVEHLYHHGKANPVIREHDNMITALKVISDKGLGAVNVIDLKGRLVGLITDGDLRRAVMKYDNLFEREALEIMTRNPVAIQPKTKAYDALVIMEKRKSQISILPVVEKTGKSLGILRLHDLMQAGLKQND